MSKVLTSPVKRWPGTITVPDYLSYPQVMAFRRAVAEAENIKNDKAEVTAYNYALLPGLCACVNKWDIVGLPEQVTAEIFPCSPVGASVRLLTWVMGAVTDLLKEAEEIPNS